MSGSCRRTGREGEKVNYSEALEQQLSFCHWLDSSDAKEWFAACDEAGQLLGQSARYGRDLWHAKVIDYQLRFPAENGECFYWSSDITDILIKAGEALPQETVLTAELLNPWHGFVWLEKPFGDQPDQMTSFVWVTRALPNGDEPEVVITPIVRMRGTNRYAGVPAGGFNCLVGQSLGDFEQLQVMSEAVGYRPLLRMWLASLLFVRQRIVSTSQRLVNRVTAKRLSRDNPEHVPLVTVIELRRRESSPVRDSDAHRDIAWSHQWIVSGHWHNYHTNEGLQPRWLMPYVKGPEDKPLKPPRAKVFAVVR